jgi:outer membrane biosynthesis protein TonB
MRGRGKFSLLRLAAMLAVASALAACTKGGQFDPTTLLDNDMFNSKKPLTGTREPVFPGGVPGASTGVPADLYKGYQPPPDQAAANPSGTATPITPTVGEEPKPAAVAEAPKPKPKLKPKPKPKVARAPAEPSTRISVGLRKQPAPASQQEGQSSQTAWPAPPSTAAQSSQTAWPAPPPTQSSQTVWPAPPPTGGQQAAQPSQSIWPNPPPTGGQ